MTGMLPICGQRVRLHALAGRHESLLLDTRDLPDPETMLVVLPELAAVEGDMAWSELPIPDGDALILMVRRLAFGDQIRAHAACSKPGCGERLELSFEIGDYLRSHEPQKPRASTKLAPGRWRLRDVSFRVPTLGDEVASLKTKDPSCALLAASVEDNVDAKTTSAIEAELDRVAPTLQRQLGASCPGCGHQNRLFFDPRSFVLQELRDQAAFLDDDIHLLATAYHWPFSEILALPRLRRIQFAERIRQDRAGGG